MRVRVEIDAVAPLHVGEGGAHRSLGEAEGARRAVLSPILLLQLTETGEHLATLPGQAPGEPEEVLGTEKEPARGAAPPGEP